MAKETGSDWERLRVVRILQSLSDDGLQRLAARLDWRTLAVGDVLLSHLEPERDVFFVIKGALRASLANPAGREISFRVLRAGAHVGEIAALTGEARTATIVAVEDALVARCGAGMFLETFRRQPEVALAVAATLSHMVFDLSDRALMSTLEARVRIYGELLRLAARGEKTNEGLVIADMPTHEEIAAAAGTHREFVTKEMGALDREGVLKRTGRKLVLLAPERLRSVVGQAAGAHVLQRIERGDGA